MITQQNLLQKFEKCDILFDNSLISKEPILRKYAEFFSKKITSEESVPSLGLHTGSVYFDIVTIILSLFFCMVSDETDADEIIESLEYGDMVTFENKRFRWLGVEEREGIRYLKIEEEGSGKNGSIEYSKLYEKNKHLIKPYNGNSTTTSKRGIRRKKSNRTDFISFLTGKDESEVPAMAGQSVVIVTSRKSFERIREVLEKLTIVYDGKRTDLLDIVHASYHTEGDETYYFGSNPAKEESMLKFTPKVSIARDLVLDKWGTKTIGIIVNGLESVEKGFSDLDDLLGRKALKFKHISMNIDVPGIENYVDGNRLFRVFACTKSFLEPYVNSIVGRSPLTKIFEQQIRNSVDNRVQPIISKGYDWESYSKIMNVLSDIQRLDMNEYEKKNIISYAYSLLNLFTTAVFTRDSLEHCFTNNTISTRIMKPIDKLHELRKAIEQSSDIIRERCIFIVDYLTEMYKTLFVLPPKHLALCEFVRESRKKSIAIIVPKAYYIEILRREPLFNSEYVYIMTANKFDATKSYDRIISTGAFSGKNFDVLRSKHSIDVNVLLYECECRRFEYKRRMILELEHKLNLLMGLDVEKIEPDNIETMVDSNLMERFENKYSDLERYIDRINLDEIRAYTQRRGGSTGKVPVAEVVAIGRFVTGETVLFSKYYKAVIYNPLNTKDSIVETDIVNLSQGTQLVFTRRDNFTRNIVDSLFEILQNAGKLSKAILIAMEKARYWKEILRNYKKKNYLTDKNIANRLHKLGCTVQSQGIKQWLAEDSNIIGPREEASLRAIAELTQDVRLLSDIPSYVDAIKQVRCKRKALWKLLGMAVRNSLIGTLSQEDDEFKIIYDNVKNMSEILELEEITHLEKSIEVATNLINRPIDGLEDE